jgi:hypothetical protein
MDLRPPLAMPEGLFVPRCPPIKETVTLRLLLPAAPGLSRSIALRVVGTASARDGRRPFRSRREDR